MIATDIPTTARRPGVWRGVLHEATDQAAMFMPVVKEAIRVHSADEIGPAVARARAHGAGGAPRDPCTSRSRPTCWTAEAGRHDAPSARRGRRSGPPAAAAEAADRDRGRAAELLERARRPLVWAGGGALQSGAGEAVARLAERLVAPVMLTYSARGLLPPGHPCLVEAPPHVPEVGALWDEADVVVAIGSDFDGMMTQGWKMPAAAAPGGDQRRRRGRVEELPARRGRRGRRRRRAPRRSPTRLARARRPRLARSAG